MPDFAQITALEAQLQREVFEEPPKDAVAVRTADDRRIGLMHSKRAQKLATDTRFCDDFQLTEDALVVFPQSSDSLEADFARVARPLHDAGYFVQWRDELLDVDDLDTGECIAHAERGLFRFFGMLTSSVYGVGVRTDGRVFVSLRSRTKQVDPGLWDALAAGMISAGESPLTALPREIAEEAGLHSGYTIEPAWRRLCVRRTVPEGWMAEDAYACRVIVSDEVEPANADGEVEEIRCLHKDELFAMIESGQCPVDTALVFLTLLFEEIPS